MRIFIDTNIFLDLLLKRKNFKSAKGVIQSVIEGVNAGYVSDITLLNIDYIANKQVVEIRSFLQLISDVFIVEGAGNKEMNQALKIDNNDLEDNLQYVLAKKYVCELIVSNDISFLNKDIKVVTSEKFV
jgi:predicted nucleic acid-binding protein